MQVIMAEIKATPSNLRSGMCIATNQPPLHQFCVTSSVAELSLWARCPCLSLAFGLRLRRSLLLQMKGTPQFAREFVV